MNEFNHICSTIKILNTSKCDMTENISKLDLCHNYNVFIKENKYVAVWVGSCDCQLLVMLVSFGP